MLQNTLTARSFRLAFLFSGQPQMDRDKNLRFYDDLTAQGVELRNFEQKTNEIILQNSPAPPNILNIVVGHFQDKFRLFIFEDFPERTIDIFKKTADATWKVFSGVWEPPAQGFSLAEVTLRYTAAAEGGKATDFLLKSCMKIPQTSLNLLGRPLHGIGLRLVSPPLVTAGATEGELPLANADFNVNIETLLDDPSRLYIQLTAKWLSIPLPPARGQMSNMPGLPTFLNPECQKPSWYLEQAENFVKEQVVSFLCKAKADGR